MQTQRRARQPRSGACSQAAQRAEKKVTRRTKEDAVLYGYQKRRMLMSCNAFLVQNYQYCLYLCKGTNTDSTKTPTQKRTRTCQDMCSVYSCP